jgi:hypothetical protein
MVGIRHRRALGGFQAFGDPSPVAVIVMSYYLGLLANLLPVPGGIGSVEGGMIGALIALGVTGGLAIVAVLTYRVCFLASDRSRRDCFLQTPKLAPKVAGERTGMRGGAASPRRRGEGNVRAPEPIDRAP